MQFQLNAGLLDTAFDSIVTISNVNINPVPEPATLSLFGLGIGGLIALGRKRGRKK